MKDFENYADDYAAQVVQMIKTIGDEDDNSIEEYIKQAFIDGVLWQKHKNDDK